mgnify:FL=1
MTLKSKIPLSSSTRTAIISVIATVLAGAIISFATKVFTAPTQKEVTRIEVQSFERDRVLDDRVEKTREAMIEAGKLSIENTKGIERLKGYLEAKEKN